MSLFKKAVGTQCLGQVDAECPNYVNKTLLPAHKRYDECGSPVREITAPNHSRILSVLGAVVICVGGGGGLIYYRIYKAALGATSQITATVLHAQKPVPRDPTPENPGKQGPIAVVNKKVDAALLAVSFKNGMGYAANHMYENALKEFSGVEAKDPAYPSLQMNMGAAYMQLKQYEKAREHLQKARKQDAHDPNIFFNLACLAALTGNTREGLQHLRTAIDLGFHDVAALRSDPDLAALRKTQGFTALVKAASQRQE